MAKVTLDLGEEYPYDIFGISASTSDYRLCWNLNKMLRTGFKRVEPITVYNKQGDRIHHNYYVFENENLQVKYRFIENKRGSSRFLPEVTQADYLLIIDQSPAVDAEEIQKMMMEIRQVLLVFQVDIDQLKQKQNLLLIA